MDSEASSAARSRDERSQSRRGSRKIGWLVAAALGAVVGIGAPSCSSNGREILGFGYPCAGNNDCAKYRLVCNPTTSKCVECLADSDCISGFVCASNGACAPGTSGTGGVNAGGSSSGGAGGVISGGCNPACPSGQVCDTANSTCVQCLADGDCASGQTCVGKKCQAPTTCNTSLDCVTSGGVCDQVSHICVDCLGNNDCGAGQTCVSSHCVASGTGGTGGVGTGGTGTGGTGGTTTGGTGGTTGGTGGTTGGTGGTGGTTTCTAGLIDNMDQGLTGAIPQCEGRVGGWYTYHDPYASQTPVPASGYTFPYVTGGSDGGFAVRTYGTTLSSTCYDAWGAGMGVSLNDPGNGGSPYNASAWGYSGIRFYAKRGTSGTSSVVVHFPDRFTDPRGGYCTAASNTCSVQGVGTSCYDDWYYTITLNTTWTQYSIPFSALTRQGTWGLPYAFDSSGIFSIQWQFGLGYTFDLYIDDVHFY